MLLLLLRLDAAAHAISWIPAILFCRMLPLPQPSPLWTGTCPPAVPFGPLPATRFGLRPSTIPFAAMPRRAHTLRLYPLPLCFAFVRAVPSFSLPCRTCLALLTRLAFFSCFFCCTRTFYAWWTGSSRCLVTTAPASTPASLVLMRQCHA